jgi:site-specific recombinase XerD
VGTRPARRHPRTPPLHDKTVRSYVAALRPALLEWSARHGHLREITPGDVRAVTAQLRGPRRQMTLVAARSLFAWAKKNGVIFRDPASRLKVGRTRHAIFQPLLPGQIEQAAGAATTPHAGSS